MKEPEPISQVEPLEAVEILKVVDLVDSIETNEMLGERERVHPLPPLPITGIISVNPNIITLEKRDSLLQK